MLGGCGVTRLILPASQGRILEDLLIYERAVVCRGVEFGSPELDVTVYLARPIENVNQELWTKDMKLEIRKNDPRDPLTIVLYHKTKADTKSGRLIERTFSEFTKSQLDEIRLDDIFSPDRDITVGDVLTLRKELGVSYSNLIDRCIYGFK